MIIIIIIIIIWKDSYFLHLILSIVLLKNDIQVKSDHIEITLITYQSFSVVKSEQSTFKDTFKESYSCLQRVLSSFQPEVDKLSQHSTYII